MTTGTLLRDLLISAAAFSSGVAIVSAWLHLRARDRAWLWFVMARAGYAISFSLLAEALAGAPFVQTSWRAWVFLVSILMAGIGFTGLAINDHRTRKG